MSDNEASDPHVGGKMSDDEAIEPPLPISLRLNSLYSVSLMDSVNSSLPEAPELDLKQGERILQGVFLWGL